MKCFLVFDLDLDSSRIQLDTLGHTPTPSVSVKSCQLCFLPGEPHLSQVFTDYAPPPVRSWSTSLVSWYLPEQCLLWYALVVHTEDMSKPAKSSFSQYVVHGLLSSSGSDLHISYPVFPWDAQYTPLPSVMCSIQTFCWCCCQWPYISTVQESWQDDCFK